MPRADEMPASDAYWQMKGLEARAINDALDAWLRPFEQQRIEKRLTAFLKRNILEDDLAPADYVPAGARANGGTRRASSRPTAISPRRPFVPQAASAAADRQADDAETAPESLLERLSL